MEIVVQISARLPWWTNAYVAAARMMIAMGMPVDHDSVVAFIANHAKIEIR